MWKNEDSWASLPGDLDSEGPGAGGGVRDREM